MVRTEAEYVHVLEGDGDVEGVPSGSGNLCQHHVSAGEFGKVDPGTVGDELSFEEAVTGDLLQANDLGRRAGKQKPPNGGYDYDQEERSGRDGYWPLGFSWLRNNCVARDMVLDGENPVGISVALQAFQVGAKLRGALVADVAILL